MAWFHRYGKYKCGMRWCISDLDVIERLDRGVMSVPYSKIFRVNNFQWKMCITYVYHVTHTKHAWYPHNQKVMMLSCSANDTHRFRLLSVWSMRSTLHEERSLSIRSFSSELVRLFKMLRWPNSRAHSEQLAATSSIFQSSNLHTYFMFSAEC